MWVLITFGRHKKKKSKSKKKNSGLFKKKIEIKKIGRGREQRKAVLRPK